MTKNLKFFQAEQGVEMNSIVKMNRLYTYNTSRSMSSNFIGVKRFLVVDIFCQKAI